jgi:hypothetical protein
MSVLALASGALGQTYPAIVEYDVIFPRNDTYAPVAVMPVVFAIQNPQAGVPLQFEINWWIYENGRHENPLLNLLDGVFEDLALQVTTFNITETLPVERGQWDGGPVCPVTAQPPPPANPHAAKVDEAIASSISSTCNGFLSGFGMCYWASRTEAPNHQRMSSSRQ